MTRPQKVKEIKLRLRSNTINLISTGLGVEVQEIKLAGKFTLTSKHFNNIQNQCVGLTALRDRILLIAETYQLPVPVYCFVEYQEVAEWLSEGKTIPSPLRQLAWDGDLTELTEELCQQLLDDENSRKFAEQILIQRQQSQPTPEELTPKSDSTELDLESVAKTAIPSPAALAPALREKSRVVSPNGDSQEAWVNPSPNGDGIAQDFSQETSGHDDSVSQPLNVPKVIQNKYWISAAVALVTALFFVVVLALSNAFNSNGNQPSLNTRAATTTVLVDKSGFEFQALLGINGPLYWFESERRQILSPFSQLERAKHGLEGVSSEYGHVSYYSHEPMVVPRPISKISSVGLNANALIVYLAGENKVVHSAANRVVANKCTITFNPPIPPGEYLFIAISIPLPEATSEAKHIELTVD